MSPTNTPNAENVFLLDDLPKERCCCGKYRMYGPDSAWSWLVAVSNFIIHFLVVGLGRMSGILYVDFMNIFDVDRKTASIPFSVQQATRNLFGPVAGIVGQKCGLRNMTIFGGAATFLGSTVLFFKMDMTLVILFWGFLFGIGAAFTTTLNQVSIDQYFEKNRATAGGFAVSGGCVGAFIFPFVLETGIIHFELQGTFLLLGSFLLFTIPAAFMLVDPPWKQTSKTEKYRQNIRHYGSFVDGGPKQIMCNSYLIKDKKELSSEVNKKSKIRIDFSILRENQDIVIQLFTKEVSSETNAENSPEDYKSELVNKLEHIYSIVEDPNVLSDIPSTSHDSVKVTTDSGNRGSMSESSFVKRFLSEKALFPTQAKLQNLYERDGSRVASYFHSSDQPRVCKILTELRKLYEILTEEPDFQTIYNKAQYFKTSEFENKESQPNPKPPSNSFWSHLKTALKLHSNPVFLLICLCRTVFMLTFVPVVTIIVDFAMDQGLEKSYGKFAIAALSLGDLFGRVCFGWVTDQKYLSHPKYMLIAMILLGGNNLALPFLHSGIAILGAVLTYGILQGSLFVRHPMLVSQFMTSQEQSVGMGCINLLSGIVGFALPAFIGYFRDSIGSYDEMFYFNGILCVAVGLLWGLEPFFPKSLPNLQNRYQHF